MLQASRPVLFTIHPLIQAKVTYSPKMIHERGRDDRRGAA